MLHHEKLFCKVSVFCDWSVSQQDNLVSVAKCSFKSCSNDNKNRVDKEKKKSMSYWEGKECLGCSFIILLPFIHVFVYLWCVLEIFIQFML